MELTMGKDEKEIKKMSLKQVKDSFNQVFYDMVRDKFILCRPGTAKKEVNARDGQGHKYKVKREHVVYIDHEIKSKADAKTMDLANIKTPFLYCGRL